MSERDDVGYTPGTPGAPVSPELLPEDICTLENVSPYLIPIAAGALASPLLVDVPVVEIVILNHILEAHRQVLDYLSDRLYDLVEPHVSQHNLALDLELEKLLTTGSYAQLEVRRRIRALKKLEANNE